MSITTSKRNRVYRRDGYCCVQCGSKENLTLDHIIPKALGGSCSAKNLQTMCGTCNQKKGKEFFVSGPALKHKFITKYLGKFIRNNLKKDIREQIWFAYKQAGAAGAKNIVESIMADRYKKNDHLH